ncbi:MAG: Gmad2 immunoglobulin-like domain-containing protein [Patescibacteria group bacterium]|jgi:hypothetical protein
MMTKKITILFLLTFFVFLSLVACTRVPANLQNSSGQNSNLKVSDQPAPGQVAVLDSNIIITKPLSNDIISSPVEITGQARVFEGIVLYHLKDAWGNILNQGTTTATVSAPDWGDYKAKLEFATPTSHNGWLEVYAKSTQDGSNNDLIRLPVIFKEYKKPGVKVYFSNIKEDPDVSDCGKVYPAERVVEPTLQLPETALAELLKGANEEETKQGFISNIPEIGITVQKFDLKDNKLTVDFNQALQANVAGACRVTAIRAQITQTLKQFPGIKEVVISIDGKTEDILQP